jgi:hypothetical protein
MSRRPRHEAEARTVLEAHTTALRSRSYAELKRMTPKVTRSCLRGRVQFLEGSGMRVSKAVTPSGAVCYLHTDFMWDDDEGAGR